MDVQEANPKSARIATAKAARTNRHLQSEIVNVKVRTEKMWSSV